MADVPAHMKSIWSRDYRPLAEPFKSTCDLQPIERPSTKGREVTVKLSGLKLTGVKRSRSGTLHFIIVIQSTVNRLYQITLSMTTASLLPGVEQSTITYDRTSATKSSNGTRKYVLCVA